jgi:hypothetical protein
MVYYSLTCCHAIANLSSDVSTAGPLIDGVASDLEKNALSDVSNLPVFQNARNLIGDAENIISGLKNIKGDMSSGDPSRIDQHQDFLSKSFGTTGSQGQLQVAAKALSDFASHDWEDEAVSLTSTSNTAITTAEPSATTSAATQSSSRSSSISSSSTMVPPSTNAQTSTVSLFSTSSSSTLVASSTSLQSTTTTSKSSTYSSSTSSCSPNTTAPSAVAARGASNAACPAPQRLEYVFVTKEGTPIDQFEAFIKTLPDQGNGVRNKDIEPILQSQLYATQLTEEEAAAIEAMDFIETIGRNDPVEDEFYGSIGGSNHATMRRKKRDDLPTAQDHFSFERTPSAAHLRLITQVPTHKNPDGTYIVPDKYTFDPTLGAGSTIYVVDTGFNSAHDVS